MSVSKRVVIAPTKTQFVMHWSRIRYRAGVTNADLPLYRQRKRMWSIYPLDAI